VYGVPGLRETIDKGSRFIDVPLAHASSLVMGGEELVLKKRCYTSANWEKLKKLTNSEDSLGAGG